MNADRSSELLSRLKASKRLPSPPGTAIQVLSLCRRDDVEIQEVADVIMSDPALSGRLLKFANSALSGVGRDVTSVREALLLLGIRTVKLTALGFSLASPDCQTRCPGFNLQKFWAESFITAAVARRLAGEFYQADREEAFTVGLLAGIGRLVMAQSLPEEYGRVLTLAREGASLIEVERDTFGTEHGQFGGQLLRDWGLPDLLVDAVTHQFEPAKCDLAARSLAQILHVATQLVPVFDGEKGHHPSRYDAARRVIGQELKLDEATWKRVAEEILADYLQVARLFETKLDCQATIMDLYAEAQEEATRVGMVAELENAQALQDNAALLRRATTDPLTGLANRAKFDERIEEEMRGVRRGHGDFSLIMMDVDHFKQFNDTHGHQVGDLVLKRVATAVQNTMREVDLVARYGGEEFAIIAPCTDRKGACIIAARIRKCVEDVRIKVGSNVFRVTASLGLAITTDYQKVPTVEQLIADADKQLYLSKQAGRNTWSYQGRTASQVAKAAVTT